VLRTGAALLDYLVTGDNSSWDSTGVHAKNVEAWIESENANGWLDRDNSLTTQIIPWALRTWGFPSTPLPAGDIGRFSGIDTPVFTRKVTEGPSEPFLTSTDENQGGEVEVWISVPLLAQAWARDRNHRVEARTETEQALKQQADSLSMERGKTFSLMGATRKGWYRKLPREYAEAVINRAQGSGE